MMSQIVLERRFDPPITREDFVRMGDEHTDCLSLYRITWQESLLAADGQSLICHFQAPDTESVRMLVYGDGSQSMAAWPGEIHDSGQPGEPNVVVERRFPSPVSFAEIQSLEAAAAWCLEQRQVLFLRSLFASDRKRMICLYQAPDAESVRLAQRQAGLPVERVWYCEYYCPDNYPPA